MALFKWTADRLDPVSSTSFSAAGIRERTHLQAVLRAQIELIAPDTLVIAEEFGNWEDSRRRIDLLCVDRLANIVVVELKRTDDGGHMELQAIRYAAMVSTMTFDAAVTAMTSYFTEIGAKDDARARLLEFLGWDEPDEDRFAQDVRIVLAAGEFSKEITTSVLWLNTRGLDIRCVRMKTYQHGTDTLLDIDQVIPLPEAADFQVRIRDKERLEKASRQQDRDFTKYDVTVGGTTYSRLSKRGAIFRVVKQLCISGINPEAVRSTITWRPDMIRVLDGTLNSIEFAKQHDQGRMSEGYKADAVRFFHSDDELIHANGKTYALTKMWGDRTSEAMQLLLQTFPNSGVSFQESVVI